MLPVRRRSAWTLPAAAVLALGLAGAASAQAPSPAPNPQMAAAQASFEALPEAERKAIQADLIWAGGFTGATSGSFGPLTFKAINTFKTGRGPADGVLPPAERAALAKAAQAARDAAGFRLIADEKTGVRIGVPTRLLPKRDAAPAGSRWQSADEKVTLDTSAAPPGDDLAALFDRATAVNPNSPRKITYKLLRPDFFVVTGETPTGKFYRRLAAGPQGLRGFSIGYDKAQAAVVDKLVIAIAGSFEPFPTGPMPTQAPAAPVAVQGLPVGGTPPGGGQQAARASMRSGAALLVTDRLALGAAASAEGCRSLSIGGRGAKLRARDDASGLALFDLDGAVAAKPVSLGGEAKPGAPLVLIAYGSGTGQPQEQALPGEGAEAGGRPAVLAPLQPGQAGAAVFDRQGRLVGTVASEPTGQLVAGVAPLRRHAIVGGDAILSLLARNGASLPVSGAQAGPELSTGAVVSAVGAAVVPLLCTR